MHLFMTVFNIYFDDNCMFETIVSTVFIGSLVHCQSLLPILIKYLIYLLEFIQFNVFLSFSTIFVILLKSL